MESLPDLCVDLVLDALMSDGSGLIETVKIAATLSTVSVSCYHGYGLRMYERLDPGCTAADVIRSHKRDHGILIKERTHDEHGIISMILSTTSSKFPCPISLEFKACVLAAKQRKDHGIEFACMCDIFSVTRSAMYNAVRHLLPLYRKLPRRQRSYRVEDVVSAVYPLHKPRRLTCLDYYKIFTDVLIRANRELCVAHKRCKYILDTQRIYFPDNMASKDVRWLTSSSFIYDGFLRGRLTRSDVVSHISQMTSIYRRRILMNKSLEAHGCMERVKEDYDAQCVMNDYVYRSTGTLESTMQRILTTHRVL
jgi:hypothetical protein